MKLEHCHVHRDSDPALERTCLRIRHDDWTPATWAEVWAEMQCLRADAERYRWLRDHSTNTWLRFQDQWQMSAAKCDAAIDAAMKEKP